MSGKFKETNYYKSEEHLNNAKKASIKGLDVLKEQKNKRICEYNLKPKLCLNCNNPINYEKKNNTFCCQSCSTSYTNKKRGGKSEITKIKIRESLHKYYENNPYNSSNKTTQLKIFPKKFCLECGCELSKKQIMRKRKFCSNSCSSTHRSKDATYIEKLRSKMLERVNNGIHHGWNSRNIISYPEQFFMNVLDNNNIKYDFNYKVKHSTLKNFDGKSYYFLDFFLNDKNIDLEIDGSQHLNSERKEKDTIRNNVLTDNGFIVYRILWKNINTESGKQYIKDEISKFLNFYNNTK